MKNIYMILLFFPLVSSCSYQHIPQKAYSIKYSSDYDQKTFLSLVDERLEGMNLKGPGNEKPVFEQGNAINREYYSGNFHISLYSEAPGELRLTCVESGSGGKVLSGVASEKCASAIFLLSTIKGVSILELLPP